MTAGKKIVIVFRNGWEQRNYLDHFEIEADNVPVSDADLLVRVWKRIEADGFVINKKTLIPKHSIESIRLVMA